MIRYSKVTIQILGVSFTVDIPEKFVRWLLGKGEIMPPSCGDFCLHEPPCNGLCTICESELDGDAKAIPAGPESRDALLGVVGPYSDPDAEIFDWVCISCGELMDDIDS